jgi:sulfate adenylyltransferase
MKIGKLQMLNLPHGGILVDLISRDKHKKDILYSEALKLPHIVLSDRQICDVEMILVGGFSPLSSFMDQKSYESVTRNMRLPSGLLWPMPITLDISQVSLNPIIGNSRHSQNNKKLSRGTHYPRQYNIGTIE